MSDYDAKKKELNARIFKMGKTLGELSKKVEELNRIANETTNAVFGFLNDLEALLEKEASK